MRSSVQGTLIAGLAAISLAACSAAPAAPAPSPPRWQEENLAGVLPAGSGMDLSAGTAVSASDAWAVGYWTQPASQPQESAPASSPLILHWNGKAWSRQPTAGIAASDSQLNAVVSSGSQVWVESFGTYRLTGSAWTPVPLPADVPDATITGGPGGQVWAIGGTASAIARWAGTAWHSYSTGNSDPGAEVEDLGFGSTSDGWAVGGDGSKALVLRWNGTAWHTAAAPRLPKGARAGGLDSVVVTPSAGVWATGSYLTGSTWLPWLVHWAGSSWSAVRITAGFTGAGGLADAPGTTRISAGTAGQPQWITTLAAGGAVYLYYSGGRWAAAGSSLPDNAGFDLTPQLVSVPGTSATWAIGTTTTKTAQGALLRAGLINYAP